MTLRKFYDIHYFTPLHFISTESKILLILSLSKSLIIFNYGFVLKLPIEIYICYVNCFIKQILMLIYNKICFITPSKNCMTLLFGERAYTPQ